MDDGCGMAFSAVHGVRAEACRLLEEKLLSVYAAREAATAEVPSEDELRERLALVRAASDVAQPAEASTDAEACALVASPECAEAAFTAGATRVYATADDLARGSWPKGVIPWLDEVCREGDHDHLDSWVRTGEPVGVGNVSELALASERGALAEVRTCVPVHNESTVVALEAAGAAGIWLSPELTLDEVCALARSSSVAVGLVVMGRARAMTSEHCVLKTTGGCIHDCARCPQRARRLSLRDIDGNLLPVRTDVHGRSRIWAAHPIDATPQAAELVSSGVTRLMADATLLSPAETTFAVERVVRAIAAVREGKRPAPRMQGATSGHLFMGIG